MFNINKIRVIEALSLGGAIIGSALLAFNVGLNQLGYVFFLISSCATIYLLVRSNASKAVLYQTFWFSLVNVIGILRW